MQISFAVVVLISVADFYQNYRVVYAYQNCLSPFLEIFTLTIPHRRGQK